MDVRPRPCHQHRQVNLVADEHHDSTCSTLVTITPSKSNMQVLSSDTVLISRRANLIACPPCRLDEIASAVKAQLVHGSVDDLDANVSHMIVAAEEVAHLLERLQVCASRFNRRLHLI